MLLRIQSTQLYRRLTTMKWGKPSDSMKSGLKTTNGLQPLTQSFAQDICRQVPSSEDHCAIKDQENSEDVSFKFKTIWLSDNHICHSSCTTSLWEWVEGSLIIKFVTSDGAWHMHLPYLNIRCWSVDVSTFKHLTGFSKEKETRKRNQLKDLEFIWPCITIHRYWDVIWPVEQPLYLQ